MEKILKYVFGGVVFVLIVGNLYFSWRTSKVLEVLDKNVQKLDQEANSFKKDTSVFSTDLKRVQFRVEGLTRSLEFPDTLRFCEEIIPLTGEVKERLIREYYHIMEDRQRVYLWLLRAPRYFSLIERIFKENGLPDDLKYVSVIESDLWELAYSRSGARGPWQFMSPTARKYGLRVGSLIDERKDFEKSTLAAKEYFIALYDSLGTWSLAVTAYNGGENRIQRWREEQGVASYYDLYFQWDETARFWFRAVVAKVIMENPEHYGFFLYDHERLEPIPAETAYVKISKKTLHLNEIAASCSCTYREIRMLNRWIEENHLPQGEYKLRLPVGTKDLFVENFREGEIIK